MNSKWKKDKSKFKKEIILKASEKIFGRKNYDEVSISEISKEAGVCIQSIYNIFGSKQKLYEEVIEFRIKKFGKEIDNRLEEVLDPILKLKKWMEVIFESMANYPYFFPIFLKEKFHYEWGIESKLFKKIKNHFVREEKKLIFIIEEAVNAKVIKKLPIHYLKSIFFSFIEAKLSYQFKEKKFIEVKQCVEETFMDFLNGLKY